MILILTQMVKLSCVCMSRVCVHLYYVYMILICTQVVKLKAQLEKMDRELNRWRAGESVSTDEQVAIDMEASTTSQQLGKCVKEG